MSYDLELKRINQLGDTEFFLVDMAMGHNDFDKQVERMLIANLSKSVILCLPDFSDHLEATVAAKHYEEVRIIPVSQGILNGIEQGNIMLVDKDSDVQSIMTRRLQLLSFEIAAERSAPIGLHSLKELFEEELHKEKDERIAYMPEKSEIRWNRQQNYLRSKWHGRNFKKK